MQKYYEHTLDRVLYRAQEEDGLMFLQPEFWNGKRWVLDRDKQFNPFVTLREIDESYAKQLAPEAFAAKKAGGVIDMAAADEGDHWLKANRDKVQEAADILFEDYPGGKPDAGPGQAD